MHPLHKIVQISGHSGLHRVLSTSKQGYVLQCLDETERRWHAPTQSKVATLEEIAIYTLEDQVPLWDVLRAIPPLELGEEEIAAALADDGKLTALFLKILPEYHPEKVYPSDMRKLIRWYLVLKNHVNFEN